MSKHQEQYFMDFQTSPLIGCQLNLPQKVKVLWINQCEPLFRLMSQSKEQGPRENKTKHLDKENTQKKLKTGTEGYTGNT